MNYTHKIDRLPIAEQEEVNQVLAPLFQSSSVVIVVVVEVEIVVVIVVFVICFTGCSIVLQPL